MLSNLKTENFNPQYPHLYIFQGSSKMNPEINSSFFSCGGTLASPKWVSKSTLRFQKRKILAPDIRVRSFFTDHPKCVHKSIRHSVHVRPRLHLQNGYPNMLSDFKTGKLCHQYPRLIIFHR